MELRRVETFRAVAEELSFSRAAARLGYVQSSVSAQVAALERELGVPLFDRLGRRVALTEAGGVMLAYSQRLLDLAGERMHALVRELQGAVVRQGEPWLGELACPSHVEVAVGGIDRHELQEELGEIDPGGEGSDGLRSGHVWNLGP